MIHDPTTEQLIAGMRRYMDASLGQNYPDLMPLMEKAIDRLRCQELEIKHLKHLCPAPYDIKQEEP